MPKLIRLLSFLRIVDRHDSTVSLTSLGVWVVLAKVAFIQPKLVDLAALLAVLLVHQGRKVIGQRFQKEEDAKLNARMHAELEAKGQIPAIKTEVDTLRSQVQRLLNAAQLTGRF